MSASKLSVTKGWACDSVIPTRVVQPVPVVAEVVLRLRVRPKASSSVSVPGMSLPRLEDIGGGHTRGPPSGTVSSVFLFFRRA